MLLIGDFGSKYYKQINEAIGKRDKEALKKLVKEQVGLGINYISTGYISTLSSRLEDLKWFVDTIQEEAEVSLHLHNTKIEFLDNILSRCSRGRPMIGYVLAEHDSIKKYLPVIKKYRPRITGLLMKNDRPPENAMQRLEAARLLVNALLEAGTFEEDIFLDPFITPICYNSQAGMQVMEAMSSIKNEFRKINLVCDISNISFGLPGSALIDKVFMVQLMTAGMNALIVNSLDKDVRTVLYASRMLLGQDDHCREYLSAHRQGII